MRKIKDNLIKCRWRQEKYSHQIYLEEFYDDGSYDKNYLMCINTFDFSIFTINTCWGCPKEFKLVLEKYKEYISKTNCLVVEIPSNKIKGKTFDMKIKNLLADINKLVEGDWLIINDKQINFI